MKKFFMVIATVLCLTVGLTSFAACNTTTTNDEILVVSRESGSGTRDAFDSLVKNEAGDSLSKKADGTKYDAIVKTANIQNSTGNVMTKVSTVKNAIGYISLGSLNSTVKAITVNGIAANAENVLNGTYKLQRPFVIATNKKAVLTEATADFVKYLQSSRAQTIVTANKYVEQASKSTYVAPEKTISGKVVIKGSTSIDPLMDKLIADYQKIGGSKVKGVEFVKDAQGSSQGVTAAVEDTTGTVIGMSSSKIKDNYAPSLNQFNIALDAVAVIVNNSNSIENLTIANLYDIYTSAIKSFSNIK